MKDSYSTKQAGELLNLSRSGVIMRIKEGRLNGTKVGSNWIVIMKDEEIEKLKRVKK